MDFLYKKHPKGTFEYASYRKKIDICVMIIMFLLALGLYVIGRVSTGSNRNILTIVAVLGLLPACKMVVDVVMCFKVRQCDVTFKERIDSEVSALTGMYNMYFTSYDRNFMLAHLVITSDSVIGCSTAGSFDEKAFSAHLQDLLLKEGIKNVHIKVFTDEDKYITRLRELNLSDQDKSPNPDIYRLIYNVTL